MTKNKRFKHEVRAYMEAFAVSYMKALGFVSQPFIVTPELVALSEVVGSRHCSGGLVVVGGRSGAGKSAVKHFLSSALSGSGFRVVEVDANGEVVSGFAPKLRASVKSSGQEDNMFIVDDWVLSGWGVGEVLRLREDFLVLPEFRGSSSYSGSVFEGAHAGLGVVVDVHSTDPYSTLSRFFMLTADQLGLTLGETVERFRGLNVTVVDVDRVVVNGKSILCVSEFFVPAYSGGFDAVVGGDLERFVSGFVPAAVKRELLVSKLGQQ